MLSDCFHEAHNLIQNFHLRFKSFLMSFETDWRSDAGRSWR